MVDPATLALVSSSVKLLESGLKLSLWDGWTTYPTQDRLAWLTKLLGLGGDTIGKTSDLFKHLAPASARPEQAVQLWAIHVACFGEALAVYWGGSGEMAGRPNKWGKWFAPTWVRDRLREVEAAIKFALDLLGRASTSPLPRDTWLETPTASPMYHALWMAFTDPAVTDDTAPLLPRERDGDMQAFERAFARAFREALARGGNAELRNVLIDGQPRGEALRQLLVTDMATWRHKHVFAGVETSEGIPDLPLGKTYVEPNAKVQIGNNTRIEPTLALLEDLLAQHRVVCVSADFGMGKSLTARTLAWHWASTYLDPDGSVPSDKRVFPVYIRCTDSLAPQCSIPDVIRRALKRNADAVGVSIPMEDPALAPPPRDQRSVVLLDGLDELVMNSEQTKALLREIFDYATDERRFIVFSRPAALPPLDAMQGLRRIPVVEILPFDTDQIEQWLWGWPKLGPSWQQIKAHGLGDLAQVPILLFMIVLTWETYASHEGEILRSQIYEAFFSTLAAGKYERSGEEHPQIKEAADQARDVLVGCGKLVPWRGEEEGRKAAVEAIVWLMERLAWEALRCEFGDRALFRMHVETVLKDELSMPGSIIEQVRVGLLLGMQAQFVGGSQQFFFGHRSFQEFAIARYWERQLRQSVRPGFKEHGSVEEALSGASLLDQESRVFSFLCERLDAWGKEDLKRLLSWARATVEDETIRAEDNRVAFRSDRRILVRQAALAIGCYLSERLGEHFDIGDGSALLMISTWWAVARRTTPLIVAPRVKVASRAHLSGLSCPASNFAHASLPDALLSGSNFGDTVFVGADLTSVNFSRANLARANLARASLDAANLFRANLFRADLSDAQMCHATLSGANVVQALLVRANLVQASLNQTSLREANLVSADLQGADLEGADLEGARMLGAKLAGANLTRANLTRANLERCTFDRDTRWPSGFVVPASAQLLGEPPEGVDEA
jgi:uncharacterized protein YjbI with pentapeptide repeats